MMKMISNSTRSLLWAAFALVLIGTPASASAFSLPSLPSFFGRGASETELPAGASLSGVCLKLSAAEAAIGERVRSATAVYEKRADERAARASAALLNRKNTALRTQTDAKLSAYFKSLDARAGTDARKIQAVSAFKVAVVKASDTRRSAVDAAVKTYERGVAAVARGRTESVRALAENMRSEFSAAISAGDGRCRMGADPTAVRTELASRLPSIERTYAAKLSDRGSLSASLSALSDAYGKALAEANAAFSETLDEASQTLTIVLQ